MNAVVAVSPREVDRLLTRRRRLSQRGVSREGEQQCEISCA